jgi:hypothetical protein
MKLAPASPSEALRDLCDELLAATGALRAVCESMGAPWDKSAAAHLINRILDIRNQVSPPKKPTPTHTKP